MSKKSTKSAAKSATETVVLIDESPTATAAPIAAPALPSIEFPKGRLTKEERAALSPEQRTARRAWMKARRASPKVRLTKLVTRMAKKAARLSALFNANAAESPLAAMAIAADALAETAKAMDTLVSDWRPTGKASPNEPRQPRAQVGDTFRLHAKRVESFAGLIEAEEDLRLVAIAANGRRGVFATEGGTRLAVPFNAVVRQEVASA